MIGNIMNNKNTEYYYIDSKDGNHPRALIFDGPNQHSIISDDMSKFFDSIIQLGSSCQTIVGITIKDSDTRKILSEIDSKSYNLISVKNKSFQKIDY